jgi:protein-tyrosine phosphatase
VVRILVVDGSDVCRAPIVEFVLRQQLARSPSTEAVEVMSRGVEAASGATMCDLASTHLGFSGPSISFYGGHRAARLDRSEVATADLVLTAGREQRSAVVRLLPGTQTRVFTWKEALVLATANIDRVHDGLVAAPLGVADLPRLLHAARGTLPRIEPSVRTAPFHWRRAALLDDPLSVADGHDGARLHKHTVAEASSVARALGLALAELLAAQERIELLEPAEIGSGPWWKRRA